MEGKSSKNYAVIKAMAFREPELLHKLLDHFAESIASYLRYQIDSGAQVCTVPPDPGDQVDPTMALRAVTKVIDIKINRKSYPIKVIKSDVKSPILGWNFIRTHKLSFEWNRWGDICLVDKRSGIKAIMHYKVSPHSQIQS